MEEPQRKLVGKVVALILSFHLDAMRRFVLSTDYEGIVMHTTTYDAYRVMCCMHSLGTPRGAKVDIDARLGEMHPERFGQE